MERVMSKKEVLEETIKIFSMIELPMVQVAAINAIQGGLRNLRIVMQMMEAEEQANKQGAKDGNANAE